MIYLLLAIMTVTPPEVYLQTYDIDSPTYEEVLQQEQIGYVAIDP